jgi:hypothetical protein
MEGKFGLINKRAIEMTEEERATAVTDPELYDFVDKSTKYFQRALNDRYDVTFDYTAGTDFGGCVILTII